MFEHRLLLLREFHFILFLAGFIPSLSGLSMCLYLSFLKM